MLIFILFRTFLECTVQSRAISVAGGISEPRVLLQHKTSCSFAEKQSFLRRGRFASGQHTREQSQTQTTIVVV